MSEFNYHYNTIEKVIHFLNEHKTDQPTLDDISEYIHVSKFHLQRTFKEWVGVSPKDFLQFLTIEHSKKLLKLGKSTLEASYDSGLSGNGRLHDLFVKFEAVSPGEFKNKGENLVIQWSFISTAFGDTLIAETAKGICKVSFTKTNNHLIPKELEYDFPKATFKNELGKNGILIKNYFDTWQLPQKKISLHFKGTPFQIQVWKALLQIPSGVLVSYQDIGKKIGNENAVRAIGTAIGKNPIAYLIPCHRVIKSNGVFGQYRWSEERKKIINTYEAFIDGLGKKS